MKENIISIQRSSRFKPFEHVVLVSDRCQVCLSKVDFQEGNMEPPDKLVKCKLCLSSIHQKHYGGNLISTVPEEWYCERCEFLLQNQEGKTIVECQFCPDQRGIMKIVEIDKRKVWTHLECITWDYPIRAFICHRLQSVKRLSKPQNLFQQFWYPQNPNSKCDHCSSDVGQFIKCRYYSCKNQYHVPCARTIGVIRQLQQMRVANNDNHIYIPVLCPEHLQKRGIDFRVKADKTSDKERYKYITNLAKIYEKQYSQLLKASKQEARLPQYVFVYGETDFEGSQDMDIQSQSEQTPIGTMSEYPSSYCQYLERELQEEFKDYDINKL